MIGEFRGEYSFLSNFWFADIEFDGMVYPTVEHAYQAAKSLDQIIRRCIQAMSTPGLARSFGGQIKLRPDWDILKFEIMEQLVRYKFTQHEDLREKLLATGEEILEEGNWHKDAIWGIDFRTGKGENHLGKILMKIRGELKNGKETVS
jgi:hypothetical protein